MIITGDKDFIPALQKTRLKAKRVAICSMRNSCNLDLFKPDARAMDFDPLWIDDFIDDIIIPKQPIDDDNELELIEIIKKFLEESDTKSSRDLGRYLSRARMQTCTQNLGGMTALEYVKEAHKSVSRFFTRYDSIFKINNDPETFPDFYIDLMDENYDEDDDEDDTDEFEREKRGQAMRGRGLEGDANDRLYNNSHKNTPQHSPLPSVQMPTFDEEEIRDELNSYTVSNLKEKLKELSLPVSGMSYSLCVCVCVCVCVFYHYVRY